MVYETKGRTAKRKTESFPKDRNKKSTRLENPQEQLVLEHKSLKGFWKKTNQILKN